MLDSVLLHVRGLRSAFQHHVEEIAALDLVAGYYGGLGHGCMRYLSPLKDDADSKCR
jgi:hypothetical protein